MRYWFGSKRRNGDAILWAFNRGFGLHIGTFVLIVGHDRLGDANGN